MTVGTIPTYIFLVRLVSSLKKSNYLNTESSPDISGKNFNPLLFLEGRGGGILFLRVIQR